MAGQSDLHVSLIPAEVEFMAEDESVEIVPSMTMDRLNFISGEFGPFIAPVAVEVSLWLAGNSEEEEIPNLPAMEVNIIHPFVGRAALQASYKHDNPIKYKR